MRANTPALKKGNRDLLNKLAEIFLFIIRIANDVNIALRPLIHLYICFY